MTPHRLPVNSWQLSGTHAQLVTLGNDKSQMIVFKKHQKCCYFSDDYFQNI